MARTGRTLSIIAAAILALVAAFPASAAKVTLKDGRQFIGTITDESTHTIKLRTTVASITTTLTLDRADIASIDRSVPDPNADEKPQPDQSERGNKRAEDTSTNNVELPSERVPWMTIEIRGIGLSLTDARGRPDTTPDDMSANPAAIGYAIRRAARANHLEHVVLLINSEGGLLEAGEQITKLMQSHDDLTFHAVITNAISAACWPVFASDYIWTMRTSATGAAMSYFIQSSTGQPQYDAKQNSINAEMMASLAESNGHPGEVARAMVEPERRLFIWTVDDAPVYSHAPPPPQADHPRTLDNSEIDVLTLTANALTDTQIAIDTIESPHAIGERLKIDGWAERPIDGSNIVRSINRRIIKAHLDACERYDEVERLHRASATLSRTIENKARRARRQDPDRFVYTYNSRTGMFTPESRRNWRERTDNAISAWREVLRDVEDLENAIDDARSEVRRADRAVRSLRRSLADGPDPIQLQHHEVWSDDSKDLIEEMDSLLRSFDAIESEAKNKIQSLHENRDRAYF